jgi:phage terminase large subunit
MELNVEVQLIEPLRPFLDPHRYKVAVGGRGSGKSWGVAMLLVIKAYQQPTRILCAREMQKSIADSVLQLLADTITRLGLDSFFEVQTTQIIGKNGSRFVFEGIRHNVSKIKSSEGLDVVWVEEGDQLTESSWNIITPTVRKPGSEIWVTFNPADINDFMYQKFVLNPPDNAYVATVNWNHNPFFPEELNQERLAMKAENENLYLHIWEGHPIANKEGSYYNDYIQPEQVKDFQIEPNLPVTTSWDLGMSDSTSIWFGQTSHQGEVRLVHAYENAGKGLQHYINYINDWRDRNKIVYSYHYAPHDIAVRELGTGVSRLETARNLGINFQVTPNIPVMDGINAVRQLLPKCWFHKHNCEMGIRALKAYRREFDEKNNTFKDKPLHDWSSHYADGFRYFAINHRKATNTFTEPVTAPDWSIF